MPDMALVAPPTSVWRDPNLLAQSPASIAGVTSMSMASLPLHHALNGVQGMGSSMLTLIL